MRKEDETMDFFKKYTCNTIGAGGNQLLFGAAQPVTGRVFYKISHGGAFDYAFAFANKVDSTYSDGSLCHCNVPGGSWTIHSAQVGKCAALDWHGEAVCPEVELVDVKPLTFAGAAGKTVQPEEEFCTDEVAMRFKAGEYLCLEMTVSGEGLPYHEESILPVFRAEGEDWAHDKRLPLPSMVGCTREAKLRVGFWGDSITQGIGTQHNAYAHWNAHVMQALGEEYACWNLGIGFGRAADAASDGAWMRRAKKNDVVVVCFGVNDIMQGKDEEVIKQNLRDIVDKLHTAGVKVVLQTVPPFDYQGEQIGKWQRINEVIRGELAGKVEVMFDAADVLKKSAEEPHCSKWGGHPDAVGCKAWADALAPVLKDYLNKL